MQFVDPHLDPWAALDDNAVPSGDPARPWSLLSRSQWLALRDTWPKDMPVGVLWENDDAIEELVPDLPRLSLVALVFPKWTDGRAYSQARLLRSRYRFKGEVRACGEVLVDMLPLLVRTGFDRVVLRSDQSPQAAERALQRAHEHHYQGDARFSRPWFAQHAAL